MASVSVAATNPCATCHPKEVSAYAQTGMAKSCTRIVTGPPGGFSHPASGTTFKVTFRNGEMYQSLTRAGLSGDYRISYVIGSGHRAFGYLVQMGEYLVQSPIAYYTQRHAWDMAPGYEDDPAPDFDRSATLDCILCHAGKAAYRRGTRNRFGEPSIIEEGISCGRCHGPISEHLAKPSRANIVNPARLSPDRRDSICEQCHLRGEARILNPGKDWDSFKPGEPLESAFTVYIGQSVDERPLRVISQSEQLRRSTCWKESGNRLWCGFCHDPHQEPTNRVAHYRARCLECHAATLSASHQLPSRNCVGCHMPSRATVDGAHTAFTDHQIRRRPSAEPPRQPPKSLTAWRPSPPEYMQRNLGLAYLAAGEREHSEELLDSAIPVLLEARKALSNDADVIAGLGVLLYTRGRFKKSAAALAEAVRLQPEDAVISGEAASAWEAEGDSDKATEYLANVIQHDPCNEDAYRILAGIYRKQQNTEAMNRVIDRYLALRPQNIEFRRMRALAAEGSR
jgi:hypothetical protein